MGERGDLLVAKRSYAVACSGRVRMQSFLDMFKRPAGLLVRGQMLLLSMLLAGGVSMCGSIL